MKDWHALTKDQTTWRVFRGSNARETSFFCSRHQFTLLSIDVPLSCSFESNITSLHRKLLADTFSRFKAGFLFHFLIRKLQ